MEICIAEGRRGQNIIVFNIQGLKHTKSGIQNQNLDINKVLGFS